MTPEFVTGFMIEALKVAIMVSAPILAFGLAAGLLVSVFQAATSINEMTLVFIPKILAVGLAMLIFFPWMLQTVMDFTSNIIVNLPAMIR